MCDTAILQVQQIKNLARVMLRHEDFQYINIYGKVGTGIPLYQYTLDPATKLISLVYSQLKRLPSPSTHTYIARWEKDLSAKIFKKKKVSKSGPLSRPAPIMLLHSYKVLAIWHLVPQRLAHMV